MLLTTTTVAELCDGEEDGGESADRTDDGSCLLGHHDPLYVHKGSVSRIGICCRRPGTTCSIPTQLNRAAKFRKPTAEPKPQTGPKPYRRKDPILTSKSSKGIRGLKTRQLCHKEAKILTSPWVSMRPKEGAWFLAVFGAQTLEEELS